MTLPAIPSPATASLEVLRRACQSVQVWAEDCEDVDAAIEALAKVTAIETYLSKKGQEAEAQGAARWLEVRIGQLLGPAVVGINQHAEGLHASKGSLTAIERHRFRLLAAHADIVAELIPTSRARILKAIKQATASSSAFVARAEMDDEEYVEVETPTEFQTIVIDPPWQYDNVATRGAAEDHYPTMTTDELAKLELPAAENCHLYLWVTNSFIREGFDLIDAWGFTYKTILTWCKPSIGMGNYFRNNTEHVLFAVKGKQPTLANNIGTWFEAPKTKHSAKPESFYDLVELSSPGPWYEMFARRHRLGDWHVFGHQFGDEA